MPSEQAVLETKYVRSVRVRVHLKLVVDGGARTAVHSVYTATLLHRVYTTGLANACVFQGGRSGLAHFNASGVSHPSDSMCCLS